jgi:hypothetical protein
VRSHYLTDPEVTEEMLKRTWMIDPPKKTHERREPATYREVLLRAMDEYQAR